MNNVWVDAPPPDAPDEQWLELVGLAAYEMGRVDSKCEEFAVWCESALQSYLLRWAAQ